MTVADEYAARAVAFYLPQFHPIPENDEWWGAGFTEWTNTAKARRLYPGHRQPTLPADLGFYDLRLPEAREAQSALAEQYGVEAFCYWHYWFGAGRRVLETPFAQVLASGRPSISFCLGWANQTWTGIWHGAEDKVLLEQTYPGPEDDQAHFDAIVEAFRDDRYLRVDGRPVFYVFRPEELPDAAAFVERWQTMARRAGLDGLYLVAECSDLLGHGPRYPRGQADGFDASVYIRLPARTEPRDVLAMRARRKALRGLEVYPYANEPIPTPAGLDAAHHQPAVYPNWDNTPRSGRRGLVLHGSSPEKFRPHVRAAVERLQARPAGERLLWVKSWNEWAEGNHLEPDLRFGHGWLRVLSEELRRGR
jgi:lipopolysaccharide biosynthesis protein